MQPACSAPGKSQSPRRINLKPLFLETGLLRVILASYFFIAAESVKVRVLAERLGVVSQKLEVSDHVGVSHRQNLFDKA